MNRNSYTQLKVLTGQLQKGVYRIQKSGLGTQCCILSEGGDCPMQISHACIQTNLGLTTRCLKRYKHEHVNHSEKAQASGDVHTNIIEGFWSFTKRSICGVYHSVSDKHLQGYLNEHTWIYNHRDDSYSQFVTLLLRAARTEA